MCERTTNMHVVMSVHDAACAHPCVRTDAQWGWGDTFGGFPQLVCSHHFKSLRLPALAAPPSPPPLPLPPPSPWLVFLSRWAVTPLYEQIEAMACNSPASRICSKPALTPLLVPDVAVGEATLLFDTNALNPAPITPHLPFYLTFNISTAAPALTNVKSLLSITNYFYPLPTAPLVSLR